MLFDGFGTPSRRNSAQARQQGATFQVMGVEEGVALRAVTAYLQVLQGRDLLALSESYIRAHETVLLGLRAQVEGGAGTQADVDQAQGRLALAEAAVTQFRGGLADAEAAFREAIGGRPADLVMPIVHSAALPATADAAVSEALASHPGVKALAENVRSMEFEVRAASATSYPRLSLDLMGTRSENAGGVKGVTGDATAMITMTYNLYRGGADKAQLEAARALLNEARLRQEESGRLLEQGVRVAFNAQEVALARMPSLEDALKSAEEGRATFDDRFEAGTPSCSICSASRTSSSRRPVASSAAAARCYSATSKFSVRWDGCGRPCSKGARTHASTPATPRDAAVCLALTLTVRLARPRRPYYGARPAATQVGAAGRCVFASSLAARSIQTGDLQVCAFYWES